MKKTVLVLSIALVACREPAAPDNDASEPILYARPVSPSSNITVQSLGSLPYTETNPAAPIGLALNTGATRSLTRVAGYTGYQTTREYPFTWTLGSGMQPLQVIDPGYGWPSGVSDNGIIVGEMARFGGIGNRAFVVTPGGPMGYLSIPSDAMHSKASAITADGTCITGTISNTAGAAYAVIWRNGVLDTLDRGNATGVSNDCTIVSANFFSRAAVWRWNGSGWIVEQLLSAGKGQVTSNGATLYSESTDISPNGIYVSGRRLNGDSSFAEVWRFNGTAWVPTDLPGGTPYAFGVDNSGRVIGHNAKGEPTLWTRSSTGTYTSQVLPSLSRSTSGWPAAINELGQISGRSTSGGYVAVLWTIN